MITNFKIFESINIGEPRVGDYVILNLDKKEKNLLKRCQDFRGHHNDELDYNTARIIGMHAHELLIKEPAESRRFFAIFSNNLESSFKISDIIRLATEDEIKDFKLKKDANKYNL